MNETIFPEIINRLLINNGGELERHSARKIMICRADKEPIKLQSTRS
jgi:hypothetical protein